MSAQSSRRGVRRLGLALSALAGFAVTGVAVQAYAADTDADLTINSIGSRNNAAVGDFIERIMLVQVGNVGPAASPGYRLLVNTSNPATIRVGGTSCRDARACSRAFDTTVPVATDNSRVVPQVSVVAPPGTRVDFQVFTPDHIVDPVPANNTRSETTPSVADLRAFPTVGGGTQNSPFSTTVVNDGSSAIARFRVQVDSADAGADITIRGVPGTAQSSCVGASSCQFTYTPPGGRGMGTGTRNALQVEIGVENVPARTGITVTVTPVAFTDPTPNIFQATVL